MSSVKTTIEFAVKKIADSTTAIEGVKGVPNLTHFEPPVYDGKSYVFFGKCDSPQIEGLYGSLNNGWLQSISDTLTTIPDLEGPPTSAEDRSGFIRHAFVPWYSEGALSPCFSHLDYPRPALVNGDVVFFAANWLPEFDRAGIFVYEAQSGSYRTLALNKAGYFNGADITQPFVNIGEQVGGSQIDSSVMVHFSSCGKSGGLAPGSYAVPVTGDKNNAGLILNINTAVTPDGIKMSDLGNGRIYPSAASQLVVYGDYGDPGDPDNGLFIYGKVQSGSVELRQLVKGGDSLPPYTIAKHGMYSEVSIKGSILAFNCALHGDGDDSAVAYIDMSNSAYTPVLVAVSNGPILGGGGTYDGDSFAMPPATDGTRIVFVGGYTDLNNIEQSGLFLWNTQTKQGYKILDSTQSIEGNLIANFGLTTDCFADGMLGFKILFQGDVTSGVYLIDLSSI